MMTLLLLGLAAAPEITAYKVPTMSIYNEQGAQVGTLGKAELPPLPLAVTGANDFGYLEVTVRGQRMFLRPADVRHDVTYCVVSGDEARRGADQHLAGARPGGVRKGAAEDGHFCIPR